MVNSIVCSILRQRFLTLLGAGVLAGLGVWAFRQLQIEAYPDLSETQVVIVTLHPGHAAEEVEQQVTIPIERALHNVPKAIARRSRTIFGLSVVDLTFDYGTDDYLARQLVLERLRDVTLPGGVACGLAPPTTPAGELYRYVVRGEGLEEVKLREVQDWVIAPRLLQLPGVGDVFAFGGRIKQYQIEVDPLELYRHRLTLRDVAEAVNANNQNSGGALVSNGEQAMVVRGVGMLRNLSDIGNIVVSSVNGVPVFIRDIGSVRLGAAPPNGIFGIGAESNQVEGIVAMRRGENPSAVLKGVKQAVEDLNRAAPEGVRLEPFYDRTELVENTLHTVTRTLVEGLIIVIAVLFLFLGSVRAALLTALTIPLSLLFAFICMHFSGIPANLLSLGALDLGIIVDGTLVIVVCVVGALERRAEEGWVGDRREIVRQVVCEMARPVFFSLVILMSAYLPLFALERVERRLFTPMAYTVCYALAGSLLLAMTLVPVLLTWLFRNPGRTWRNPILPWITRGYEIALRTALRVPVLVLLLSIALGALAFVVGKQLGTEFLPQLDEGVIWIRANLPPGIALEKSAALASQMRELVQQSPEVRFVTSQTGRQESGTEPFGPNRNELLVALTPYSTWPSGKTKADLVQELSIRLHEHIPGATFNFTQPIIDMVTEAVTGSSADLAIILTGPELSVLREAAEKALGIVKAIPGAADTAIDHEADQAQLCIRVNRDEAARYGINVSDIQEVIEMAIGGGAVGSLFEGDRQFDITVRYVAHARSSIEQIGNLLVRTPSGEQIPLAQVASVRIEDGATVIARRENQRQVSVRTNVRGRDQGTFVAETQEALQEAIQLPPGYRMEWGGQFENLERAAARLAIILPVTVALLFGLLFLTFKSVSLAGLVLLTIPFSVIGGVLGLHFRGIPLSVSAAVGFVSLLGVAVMSGVLYISAIDKHRRLPGACLEDAVVGGAKATLVPALSLILVALLGMVPAALARGIGSDIQRPLATVVVAGLASTLLLTLVALPVLYYCCARLAPAGRPNQTVEPVPEGE